MNRSIDENSKTLKMDDHLFNASFMAKDNGPIDIDIHKKYKEGRYDGGKSKELKIKETSMKHVIERFIGSVLDEIFLIEDASLIEMTRTEREWIRINVGNPEYLIMDNEHIITEHSSQHQ